MEKDTNAYKKFDNNDYKNVRLFSKLFNAVAHLSFSSLILLFIGITIFAFVSIYVLCGMVIIKDVTKELKKVYDQDFVIVEDFGKNDSKVKGLYIVAPKYNKEITFKVLNRTESIGYNDYADQRIKYYFEHCEDKNLTKDFYIEQEYLKYEDIDGFLHYTVMISVNEYNEVAKKVEKAYNLARYFFSKDNKMTGAIVLENASINYHYFLQYSTQNSLEQEISSAQYYYMQKSNNENSSENPPEILTLYINGSIIAGNGNKPIEVIYEPVEKVYNIINPTAVLNQMENVEIEKISFWGEIKQIKYNGKKYKVQEEIKNSKKKNTIYLYNSLEDFFEVFDSKIVYDYLNKCVYVTI